jgi:phosphatidylserine/phosphatidylglycerophosphate/cardiolipin synthase-like enzyme
MKKSGRTGARKAPLYAALGALLLALGASALFLFPSGMTSGPVQASMAGAESAKQAVASWWELMFVDPSRPAPADPSTQVPQESIEERLIARIDAAEKSIHLACFEFNLAPVAKALVAAKARGVDVRWMTDDENGLEADGEKGHGQFALLSGAGIDVKSDGRSALMHDKFIVFDARAVWTGATNLTVAGMFENDNNTIAIESPELASIYEREFSEMWSGQFNAKSPSDPGSQIVTIEGTRIQALFSPEDSVMSRIVPIVAASKSSVRIMAFSFTHEDLGDAVLGRHAAGVDTAVIFETRGSETKSSQLSRLAEAGVPLRQDGNPSSFHHKVIVVDGHIVITGSLNFSANADESNSENTLVIDNGEIAALYLKEFERCWALGKIPGLAKPADQSLVRAKAKSSGK